MIRALRWLLAVVVGALGFALAWWSAEARYGMDRATAVTIAAVAGPLLATPFVWWASREDGGGPAVGTKRRRWQAIALGLALLVVAALGAFVLINPNGPAGNVTSPGPSPMLSVNQLASLGRESSITAFAFSRDGHLLAAGGEDQTTVVWDITNPLSPGSQAEFVGGGATVGAKVKAVAFSPDGGLVATASRDPHAVKVWDTNAPASPKATFLDHTDDVTDLAFAPEGLLLASASEDGRVLLWDLSKPEPDPTAISETGPVDAVAFSRTGSVLATGLSDGSVTLWDLADPVQPSVIRTFKEHTGDIQQVVFHDSGRMATASADKTVKLWDVADPAKAAVIATLSGHTETVFDVDFHPLGTLLVTGSGDKTVKVWDIAQASVAINPQLLATLTDHGDLVHTVAFSPSGDLLATGDLKGTVILWDWAFHRPQ